MHDRNYGTTEKRVFRLRYILLYCLKSYETSELFQSRVLGFGLTIQIILNTKNLNNFIALFNTLTNISFFFLTYNIPRHDKNIMLTILTEYLNGWSSQIIPT